MRHRLASFAIEGALAALLAVLWLSGEASFLVVAVVGGAFGLLRQRERSRVAAHSTHLERQIDALPLATIAFDGDARIVTWNAAAERLFGWSAREIVGRRNPTVPRSVRRESDSLHRRILEGETLRGVETIRRRRDGAELEVALYSAPLDPAAGASAGFLVLYDDIAERKRAERARDDAEGRYRGLIEALPLVTYIDYVDDDATNIYTSPQIEDVLGWSLREWKEDPRLFKELLHPEDRERVMAHVHEANETHHVFEDEYRMLHKDGHYVWVRDHSAIVADADGSEYARGFLLDITAQKKLEEQLLQSQKMDALGQFAGGIAHDFNNLLTGISGYADLAASSIDDSSPARRCLDGIKTAATEAASLTSRLLAFSRRHVPERRLIDLNETVVGAVDLLRRVLREDIEVQLDLADSLPPIAADPAQLKQVVLNLALNGRDAIFGAGTLRLETSSIGEVVALRVRDDGIGMDDATRVRALEPFFTTKEAGEGTGLGLSVVYGVVDALGGTIGIESESGAGTTVEVLLPAADGVAHASETLGAAPRSGRAERVLVVEDRKLVRDLARDLLIAAGFDVATADGADAALELDGPFDLLLTDVVMPATSGPALAERLRATQPDLPVVFMSGYTDDVLGDDVLALPGTSFLRKPFGAEALVDAVRSSLDYRTTGELTSASR